MIRLWLGLALLAVSWLPGLGMYHAAEPWWWASAVAAGALLLAGPLPRMPGRWTQVAALVLAIAAAAVWPWPYRGAAGLVAAGLVAAALLGSRRDWPRRLAGGLVLAGVALVVQGAALYGYEALTARSHDLPWPLPHLVGAVAALLGHDSAVSGTTVALHSMRQVHRLGATWELLLDPATLALLAGGMAMLAARWGGRGWPRRAALLAAIVLAWLPVRVGLLVALYLHRVLVTDYDAALSVMNQFWSTGVHLALLAGPVLLAWRVLGRPAAPSAEGEAPGAAGQADAAPAGRGAEAPGAAGPEAGARAGRGAAGAALVAAGVALVAAGVFWDPVGERQAGCVLVEEGHSTWEPTGRPMDTEWYGHESGYNYACLYDYLGRFYAMGRLTEPLSDAALGEADVLVLKTPTSAYRPQEVDAVVRFVERGGGLVLIGEHTNVFGTGEHLNAVARRLGLEFRYDCLFGIDSFFEQRYELPLVPHPIVQHMPPLDFSVSCSLAPGSSRGRAVIRGTGLKNAPADFHASNFYPQAQDRPDMRYGAFVQLWAARRGQGRVVAFTDSTIFSNFSLFEPGKSELVLGMVEWANRRDGSGDPRPWLAAGGTALAVAGVALARRRRGAWVLVLAAGMAGHAASAVAVREHHRRAMPPPAAERPYVLVTIDQTVSEAVLSKGGFIGGRDDGFGIFERWILRLGYFTRRAAGPQAPQGQLVVIFHPSRDVAPAYLEALVQYVTAGGRLLVLDSPKNAKSTANSLLWPFGLEVRRDAPLAAKVPTVGLPLTGPEGWPAIQVPSAYEVRGGRPLARVQSRPVAATVGVGRGTVTVVGFGSRFTDVQMGVTGDVVPDAKMREVYEFEYALLRALVEDRAAEASPPGPAAP